MTNETRIAFAERRGWKYLPSSQDGELEPCYKWMSPAGIHAVGQFHHDSLPPLTFDDVHTALMGMSDEEWREFAGLLLDRLAYANEYGEVMTVILVLKTPLATLVECFLEATKGRK